MMVSFNFLEGGGGGNIESLGLDGKDRLTLVSKCLSEIASTEGTIWMVFMVCEREQQIGGGQIKDIGRGE
jgi:hypothetical protein